MNGAIVRPPACRTRPTVSRFVFNGLHTGKYGTCTIQNCASRRGFCGPKDPQNLPVRRHGHAAKMPTRIRSRRGCGGRIAPRRDQDRARRVLSDPARAEGCVKARARPTHPSRCGRAGRIRRIPKIHLGGRTPSDATLIDRRTRSLKDSDPERGPSPPARRVSLITQNREHAHSSACLSTYS